MPGITHQKKVFTLSRGGKVDASTKRKPNYRKGLSEQNITF